MCNSKKACKSSEVLFTCNILSGSPPILLTPSPLVYPDAVLTSNVAWSILPAIAREPKIAPSSLEKMINSKG